MTALHCAAESSDASSHRPSYGRCERGDGGPGTELARGSRSQYGRMEDDDGHCGGERQTEMERDGGREFTSVCPAPSTARARLSWLTVVVVWWQAVCPECPVCPPVTLPVTSRTGSGCQININITTQHYSTNHTTPHHTRLQTAELIRPGLD